MFAIRYDMRRPVWSPASAEELSRRICRGRARCDVADRRGVLERDQLKADLSDAQERITETGAIDDHHDGGRAPQAADQTYLADLETIDSVPFWEPSRDLDIGGTIYVHGLATRQIGACYSSGGLSKACVEYSIGQRYTIPYLAKRPGRVAVAQLDDATMATSDGDGGDGGRRILDDVRCTCRR